jgi:hypothetical protein
MAKCKHCGTVYPTNKTGKYKRVNCCVKHCVCKSCGAHFESYQKRAYCKPECRRSKIENSAKPKLLICQFKPCGKEYYSSFPHSKYCCRRHQDAASNNVNQLPLTRDELRVKHAKSTRIYIRTCPETKALFVTKYKNKAFITNEAKYVYMLRNKRLPRTTHKCTNCKSQYTKTAKSKNTGMCKRCNDRYHNMAYRAKRRATELGIHADNINPYEIFYRDKWHCKCCGIHTPKSLRGSIEPNAPELDHIIPLSRGGEHTYANTQLLCRKCNQEKSDTIDIHTIKKAKFQYEIFSQYGRVGH